MTDLLEALMFRIVMRIFRKDIEKLERNAYITGLSVGYDAGARIPSSKSLEGNMLSGEVKKELSDILSEKGFN